jgi:hypothetical protein
MKWVQALVLVLIGLVGCKSQSPLADPFGRTTIPPPGTGGMFRQPATGLTPPIISAPAVGATGPTTPSAGNFACPPTGSAPGGTAPAWVPPSSTGAAPPGLIPPPSQVSTISPPVNNPSGVIFSPPAIQPGASTPPVGTPGVVPTSPSPISTPNYNSPIPGGAGYPTGATGGGVVGGYYPPSGIKRSPRPFFSGGVPDRRTLPVTTTLPRG